MPDDEETFMRQIEAARSYGNGAVLLINVGTTERVDPICASLLRMKRWLRMSERAIFAENHSVLAEAMARGRITVIACVGAAPLYRDNIFSCDVEGLLDLRAAGVGVMGLAYDWRGLCADGVLEQSDLPLTALGRSAVRRMSEAGIVLDLAHCGRRSSLDAIASSAQPVIFSHVGAARVQVHPAHLTDEQIRACAERGGVIGVAPRDGENTATQSLFRHLDYLIDLVGVDHVHVTSADADTVTDRLRERSMCSAQIAQLIGGNLRRVFELVWSV